MSNLGPCEYYAGISPVVSGYETLLDDLMLLQNMIDLLQNSQRKELSNP